MFECEVISIFLLVVIAYTLVLYLTNYNDIESGG